jgi:hypothetical protein
MILSGVFERHPALVYVTTEISGAADIPAYLLKLDVMVKMGMGEGTPFHEHITEAFHDLRRAPSDYFKTNCYVAGPTHDLRPAFDVGTPNLMWGADVPHSEGTSPYTLEVLRMTMADLPRDDIDELVAVRAAEVYGLDLAQLQSLADRIGPTVGQIKTPLLPEERPTYPDQTRCSVFMDLATLLEPTAL